MMFTAPVALTLLGAAMQIVNSGCIGLREILLSPDRPNYPNARQRLRAAMFMLSAALLYHGVDQACRAFAHPPRIVSPAGLALTSVWLACSILELERTSRQWLPARIQRRIQQLMLIASCKSGRDMRRERERNLRAVSRPLVDGAIVSGSSAVAMGPALAALAASGAIVTAPNEPPSALRGDGG